MHQSFNADSVDLVEVASKEVKTTVPNHQKFEPLTDSTGGKNANKLLQSHQN